MMKIYWWMCSLELTSAEEELAKLEFRRMFSNPMDPNPCYVEIQAGSGGTEAQDWASMLLRMYMRWIERHGFKAELMEESDGDVAGLNLRPFALKVNMPMVGCALNRVCIV